MSYGATGPCNLQMNKICGPSALFNRNERPGIGADILRIRPNQFVISALLLDMGGPAGGPGHYKYRREMGGGDTKKMIGSRAEKIGIGKQVLFFLHNRLDLIRHFEKVTVRRRW